MMSFLPLKKERGRSMSKMVFSFFASTQATHLFLNHRRQWYLPVKEKRFLLNMQNQSQFTWDATFIVFMPIFDLGRVWHISCCCSCLSLSLRESWLLRILAPGMLALLTLSYKEVLDGADCIFSRALGNSESSERPIGILGKVWAI